jgi:hypothetical protein
MLYKCDARFFGRSFTDPLACCKGDDSPRCHKRHGLQQEPLQCQSAQQTHFSFVQCPNSSGVSSRQLLFKVKICHTAVKRCTYASKIAWSFAPSHILGRGPCATTRHAPLQGRNRTCRLAQRPISLGMYLSLLLWHASVLSWVSSPISGGKSDRLRHLCVCRAGCSVRVFSQSAIFERGHRDAAGGMNQRSGTPTCCPAGREPRGP